MSSLTLPRHRLSRGCRWGFGASDAATHRNTMHWL